MSSSTESLESSVDLGLDEEPPGPFTQPLLPVLFPPPPVASCEGVWELGYPLRKRKKPKGYSSFAEGSRKVASPAKAPWGPNLRTKAFRKTFFAQVPDKLWNDWYWQLQNRFRSLNQLDRILRLSEEERQAMCQGGLQLPVAITPYYASLLDPLDPDHPLRRMVVPRPAEFIHSPGEAADPLGEETHSPVPGLVHRYPDRVLLLAHDFCSTYCRYCTRSRLVGHGEMAATPARLQAALDYIRRTPTVRDVLVSGGDPLTLSDERLEQILSALRAIRHVEIIRLGTKVPAVLPQRITPALCRMLRKYHPLWISLHFQHPEECTAEAYQACSRLADAGIPLGAQTVLLKGINDSVETMRELVHRLLQMRVRPYYLFQCDPIYGSAHFRTPVSKGIEIIQGLRGYTSGYAVPHYVVDLPGGGGKVPLQPEYLVGRDANDLVFRNFEGKTFRYPDPIP